MSVTIHRDKTFEFNGRRYAIMAGSDIRTVEWDGYTVMAVLSDEPGDYMETAEYGFWRLRDVRHMLDRAEREGWEYIADSDGNDLHFLLDTHTAPR